MGDVTNRFVHYPRRGPRTLNKAERLAGFGEIYRPFAGDEAAGQSSRCAQCGVPYCQSACPLHNNIPDWLNLAAQERWEDAWRLSSATSALPEICGRICPQDRLCEGACVLDQSGWEGVTIGSVEKTLGDMAFENGWVDALAPLAETGLSVAIVGAGPAGLAAADRLRGLGHAVTIYDRYDRAGGLLTYGIPGFKLEKEVVERRVRRLADGGVAFTLNFEIGRDATLDDLRDQHDAVLLAIGVNQARRLTVPGAGSEELVAALDYLTASNRKGFGDAVPDFDSGRLDAAGQRVVVIGGGDTAMDCVRTAVRQGATSVVCLYRRDRAGMPGSRREVEHAETEGVRFEWQAAPRAILGDARTVTGVRAVRTRPTPATGEGRLGPSEIAGSEFDLPADLVIDALGFDCEDLRALLTAPDLAVARGGEVTLTGGGTMTSIPGVFAAGDIVRGASLVVWAVKDGQDAAADIDRWLQARTQLRAAE